MPLEYVLRKLSRENEIRSAIKESANKQWKWYLLVRKQWIEAIEAKLIISP